MNDPITLVKQATPSWFFKIHDIAALKICRSQEATSGWSVIGHLKKGGFIALDSFATEEAAREFTQELGLHWPHLATKS